MTHIPLHTRTTTGKINNTDVNLGLLRHHIRVLREMECAMLTFHRVIGLTTIDPAAINADAHASPSR